MTKKVALLMPTMGKVPTFIPMIDSLVNNTKYPLTTFATFNPKKEDIIEAGKVMTYSQTVSKNIGALTNNEIEVIADFIPNPIGYAGAINNSYRKMLEYEKENNVQFDYVIFGNDDLIFTSDWLYALIKNAD